MSHDMTKGGVCGLPDGHRWNHRSIAGVEYRNARWRERYAADPTFRAREDARRQQSRWNRPDQAYLYEMNRWAARKAKEAS